MSFFGDLHNEYAGNVVKAMASAKHGYPVISELLKSSQANVVEFFAQLTKRLVPTLIAINRLTPNIIELVINSPMSAENFKPGQFFRLQNYVNSGIPLIEGIALTGAKVENDNISTIVVMPNKFKEKKVCGFLNNRTELVKTITKLDFPKYKEKKDLKRLIKEYDFFIASAALMPSVATTFGKVLGARRCV
jgi:hypothetical protein